MKMWINNLNIEKILVLFCANIIVSCSTPIDPVHKKVRLNKHQLPIISIIADSMELFDDTLGIYNLCTVEFTDPNLKPIIVSVDQCVLDMTTLSTTYYDGVSSGYWGDLCEPWA